MSGFTFACALEDGLPADPAMFVTATPDLRVGDEFPGAPSAVGR
jgi:hypothetical protein